MALADRYVEWVEAAGVDTAEALALLVAVAMASPDEGRVAVTRQRIFSLVACYTLL